MERSIVLVNCNIIRLPSKWAHVLVIDNLLGNLVGLPRCLQSPSTQLPLYLFILFINISLAITRAIVFVLIPIVAAGILVNIFRFQMTIVF